MQRGRPGDDRVRKRKDQLIGMTPWEEAPERQPDGRLSRDAVQGKHPGTLRQGRNRFEFLENPRDGREILVEISHTVIPIGGRPIIYTVWRDITERRKAETSLQESERKFRDLVEKSFVGVYLLQDGLFKYVNARLAEIYKLTVEEITNIKGPADMVHPDDIPEVDEHIRRKNSGEVDSTHLASGRYCRTVISAISKPTAPEPSTWAGRPLSVRSRTSRSAKPTKMSCAGKRFSFRPWLAPRTTASLWWIPANGGSSRTRK